MNRGVGFLLFAVLRVFVFASDIPAGNSKNLNEFLRDHTKEHRERIEKNLERPFVPYDEIYRPTPVPPEGKAESEACLPIHTITINGSSILSDKELRQIKKQYEDKCLTVPMIEELLRKITAAYHAKGYITSRASLKVPQESTKDGILEIIITEGWIEQFHFNENSFRDRVQGSTVLRHLVGKNLNIRHIDHAMEQINRLSSQHATMQIEPGGTIGSSTVVVKTDPKDTVLFSLNYRDTGKDLEDGGVWTPSLLIENPLALNDQLRASYSRNEYDNTQKHERAKALSYTFPYGFWLFDFSYSKSEYLTTIEGSNASFRSWGFAETDSLNANRLLFRNQKQKISFDAAVEKQKNKSYINQTLVGVSSHAVTNTKAGFNYLYYLDSGVLSASIHTKRGVGWLSADDVPADIDKDAPNKRFRLYGGSLMFLKYFQAWQLSINFLAQHSEDELLTSEQFSSIKGISEDNGQSLSVKAGFSPFSKNRWLSPFYMDFGYSFARISSVANDRIRDSASVFSASLQYNHPSFSCQANIEFDGKYPNHIGYSKNDYPHQSISCTVNFGFI